MGQSNRGSTAYWLGFQICPYLDKWQRGRQGGRCAILGVKFTKKIEMEAEMLGYKSVNFFCPLVCRVFFKKIDEEKKQKKFFWIIFISLRPGEGVWMCVSFSEGARITSKGDD
jgi:hypothetical protein